MEQNNNTLNNFAKERDDISKDNTSDRQIPFFKENKLKNTLQRAPNTKLDRGVILQTIQRLAPIGVSELAREMKCARNTIYYAIRDFEFAGIIETKVILSEKNTAKRIIVIPDHKRMRLEK